jgi:hypothetical protein
MRRRVYSMYIATHTNTQTHTHKRTHTSTQLLISTSCHEIREHKRCADTHIRYKYMGAQL